MTAKLSAIGGGRGRAALRLRRRRLASPSCWPAATDAAGRLRSLTPPTIAQRHPITLREGERTVEIFIGRNRGGLTAAQRADVLAFAQQWRREATGGIVIDVPWGGPNDRAAADSMREIQSIFAASGVPHGAVAVRRYQPIGLRARQHPHQLFQAGRRSRPLRAVAGGSRPDLGQPHTSRTGRIGIFGCATQRNLAAMVDNPADLVQPRGETPAYAAAPHHRARQVSQGRRPSGTYSGYDKAKISELGK